MEEREVTRTGSDPAERPLYGIGGPRRRPRADRVVDLTEPPPTPVAGPTTPTPGAEPSASSVRDRWLAEARARGISAANVVPRLDVAPIEAPAPAESPAPLPGPDAATSELTARFDTLQEALTEELRSAIDDAVGRIESTFEQEIQALRNLNTEEGKRLRSTNGEELVRTRASNTAELERIRTAIEDGIGRLLDVLEDELER